MSKKKHKAQTPIAMRFKFTAVIKSPTERSVLHFKAKETGAPTFFEGNAVNTEYVGTVYDNTFQTLLKLFEQAPTHVITLASK